MPLLSFFFNLEQLGDFLHQYIPVGMHMDVLSMFFKMELQIVLQNFNSHLIKFILRRKTRKIRDCHLGKFLRHTHSPLASPCFVAYLMQRALWMIVLIYRFQMKTPWKTEWVCDIFLSMLLGKPIPWLSLNWSCICKFLLFLLS